ncbi:MAG: OadG-related small transporter subunit [Treponema sp.]
MTDLTAALTLAAQGMAGLFAVMICIMILVMIMKKFFK